MSFVPSGALEHPVRGPGTIEENRKTMKVGVRKRLSGVERQDEIILAAVDLAGEQGMDKVTGQAIADAVGVTQGGVFRHFPTMETIWIAVVHWTRGRLMGVIDMAASQATDPLDAVTRMFFAHIGFAENHPALPRLLFSTSPRLKKLLQEMLAGYEGRISQLLGEAKAQGLVKPDLDGEAAAALYLAIIQGLVTRALVLGPRRSLTAEARKLFPIYLAGIGAVIEAAGNGTQPHQARRRAGQA